MVELDPGIHVFAVNAAYRGATLSIGEWSLAPRWWDQTGEHLLAVEVDEPGAYSLRAVHLAERWGEDQVDSQGSIELLYLDESGRFRLVNATGAVGEPNVCVAYLTRQTDTDQDGLPDEWEILYGLDPQRSRGLL